MDDAYKCDLRDLLLDRIRFVVPPFQRRYVWTATEWGRLWDDLIDTAGAADATAHFLGAIVLQRAHERAGEPKIRRVVDGQQRLTTVQLLLAAVRNVATGRGLDDIAHQVGELIANRPAGPGHELKIVSSLGDQEAFRLAMTTSTPAAGLAEPPVQAYRYFVGRVASLAGYGRSGADALRRLVDVVGRGVYVVVMDLSDRDDPQAIYERLNSGGAVLRPSELIRNHVFYQCDRQGLVPEQMYEEYWAEFDDGYWFDGALPTSSTRLDRMLRAFLIMETEDNVPIGKLFRIFRDYLTRHEGNLRAGLARIARYGDIFTGLDTGTGLDPYESEFVDRLRIVESTVLTPVLLRLFGEFEPTQRRPALTVLESYLLRRELSGQERPRPRGPRGAAAPAAPTGSDAGPGHP